MLVYMALVVFPSGVCAIWAQCNLKGGQLSLAPTEVSGLVCISAFMSVCTPLCYHVCIREGFRFVVQMSWPERIKGFLLEWCTVSGP